MTPSQRAPTALLPRSTLGAVLHGTALPRNDLLLALAHALGVQDLRGWQRARDKAALTRGQLRQTDPWHTTVEGNTDYRLLDPHAHSTENEDGDKRANGDTIEPSCPPAHGFGSLLQERRQQAWGPSRRGRGAQLATCDLDRLDKWRYSSPTRPPANRIHASWEGMGKSYRSRVARDHASTDPPCQAADQRAVRDAPSANHERPPRSTTDTEASAGQPQTDPRASA